MRKYRQVDSEKLAQISLGKLSTHVCVIPDHNGADWVYDPEDHRLWLIEVENDEIRHILMSAPIDRFDFDHFKHTGNVRNKEGRQSATVLSLQNRRRIALAFHRFNGEPANGTDIFFKDNQWYVRVKDDNRIYRVEDNPDLSNHEHFRFELIQEPIEPEANKYDATALQEMHIIIVSVYAETWSPDEPQTPVAQFRFNQRGQFLDSTPLHAYRDPLLNRAALQGYLRFIQPEHRNDERNRR